MSKDGGPAFPALDVEHFPAGHGHGEHNEITGRVGMALRDYFAAQAMQGYLVSPHTAREATDSVDKCAQWAYMQADAMLEARTGKCAS